MLSRLRASFAAKLLLGGLVLSLVIIGGVAGYLLVSRNSQTRETALSNADNRAAVMRQVLLRFTGAQSYATARGLATQAPLMTALLSPQPATAVPALFAGSPPVDLAGEVLVISDASGHALFARTDPSLSGVNVTPFEQSTAIAAALRGTTCAVAGGGAPGACGVEVLPSGDPAYSVAVPVTLGGRVLGTVAYVAPLPQQLDRFNALFQFPTAFIPADRPGTEVRQRNGQDVAGATPAELSGGVASGADPVHATYTVSAPGVAPEQVAGSFDAVTAPDGHTRAGYVGVEVPLAPFVGDQQTDELTLGVITLFVLLLLALAVVLFVERVVRRPIRRLERGVARIASGDYTSEVEVRSRDELGRLATSVNRMRDSIRAYTSEIESARARLDRNVERVSDVSRALTTTTGGVATLEQEVVRAATAIMGEGSNAVLAERDGDAFFVRAALPDAAAALDLEQLAPVLRGEIVRREERGRTTLALPMFNQGEVAGALMVRSAAARAITDEEDVLAVLANNAAIAMQNARLYEQERETVRRLRELDAMKTDFLATVQHELRTPLTAIIGLSDLIDMCWDVWDEAPKLEAVRDIQIAARNLYDIVETIIDFSSVQGEGISLDVQAVPVAAAVEDATRLVGERYKGGLPTPVRIDVGADVVVEADAERFGQVLRALIDNAVKFSDGNGMVTVRARPGREAGRVSIEVADQGIGISDDDLEHIFDRFFQVDTSATRRYGGTGMGLALVRQLVAAHGGTIDVETALGQGTRVIVDWPAASTEGEPEPAREAAPTAV